MKKILYIAKYITWFTAVAPVFILIAFPLSRIYRTGDFFASLYFLLLMIFYPLAVQLGLILSPLAIGKHMFIRVLTILFMLPFLYYFWFELRAALEMLSPSSVAYWKYDSSRLIGIFIYLGVALVYVFNIIALLFIKLGKTE